MEKQGNIEEFFKKLLELHPAPVIAVIKIDEKNNIILMGASSDINMLQFIDNQRPGPGDYVG